ncbi:Rid family hydrolase [Mesorhizobium sp. ISC25]|uniref:Rid family hydrolase n=1 Tax=Mesorhizobium sp. ISC25 TaxID=3077335 RepID=UPI0035E1E62B
MARQVIVPKNSPPPLGPYSPATRAGDTIYVGGALPTDAEGKLVGDGDVAAQTRHELELIKSVLEAANASLDDVVFNQVLLRDMSDYAAMNAVYRTYFPKDPPARFCIRADLVKPEFLVEIIATAHVSRQG